MDQFWKISGIVIWLLIIIYSIVRVFFGKNWVSKFGTTILLGAGLKSSARKMVKELRQGKLKDETLTDVGVYVFWRITKIGFLGLIIAGLPIWLLIQQNSILRIQNELFSLQDSLIMNQNIKLDSQLSLFSYQNLKFDQQTILLDTQTNLFSKQNLLIVDQNRKVDEEIILYRKQNSLFEDQNKMLDVQNYRINVQNNLLEADRRSSLVFLMSNILDKVDDEIKQKKKNFIEEEKTISDTTLYRLSYPLIGRIVALSKAFKPYKVLDGGSLSKQLSSPERSQLFTALLNSGLDSLTMNIIISQGDFSYASLGTLVLAKQPFKSAKLNHVDFYDTNIQIPWAVNDSVVWMSGKDTWFSISNGSFILEVDMRFAQLKYTDFYNAQFQNSDLAYADFTGTNFKSASINNSNLENVRLDSADISGASFYGSNLSRASFINVKGITIDQMLGAISLFKCIGLPDSIKSKIKLKKPCLFEERGCQ